MSVYLHGVVDRRAHRDRTVVQAFAQCLAVEQLRHDVGRAVVHTDVVDGEDVRVIERGGGARFLLETMQPPRIGGGVGREHLDRDVAPEPRVAATIDLAHSSGTEQRKDFVRTEVNPGRQWHAEEC